MEEQSDTTTTDTVSEATVDAPAADQAADSSSEVAKWKALARKHEAQAKANVEAAKKLAEIENANKSEQQRLQERAEQAEKARMELETRLLRTEVATAKGIPAAFAQRLSGTTREEMEADADQLLPLMVKQQPQSTAQDALVGTRTPPAQREDVETVAARIFQSG